MPKIPSLGTPLVVQRLRLCVPNAAGLGLTPGQGSRSHMLQLKIPHPETEDFTSQNAKVPHATTEDHACLN